MNSIPCKNIHCHHCNRFSVLESKLDEILHLLKNPGSTSSFDPVNVEDAIRAHIAGDRTLIDALRLPE